MSQLLKSLVKSPDGIEYEISTVVLPPGGAPSERPFGFPLGMSDFEDINTWPFETMVFKNGSRTGLYHAPYATEEEALHGHTQVVEAIKIGSEWYGGVEGPFGTPSITPEQWRARLTR